AMGKYLQQVNRIQNSFDHRRRILRRIARDGGVDFFEIRQRLRCEPNAEASAAFSSYFPKYFCRSLSRTSDHSTNWPRSYWASAFTMAAIVESSSTPWSSIICSTAVSTAA